MLDSAVADLVRAALAEDLGVAGDITTAAVIDAGEPLRADFVTRRSGVCAGLECAELAFTLLDASARFTARVCDGDRLEAGQRLARVEARASALFGGERVALNLLGRLSGIATLTSDYVAKVAGTKARIVDTRKTTPLLRGLEKRAVRLGGGASHRFGLFDAMLIKDNHIAVCGGVGPALVRARAAAGHMVKIEVEVDDLAQLEEALRHDPDVIMLDNFSLADLASAVKVCAGRTRLEASGGVTLDTVQAIAATGVDFISVGALTHSAPTLDIGLDIIAA